MSTREPEALWEAALEGEDGVDRRRGPVREAAFGLGQSEGSGSSSHPDAASDPNLPDTDSLADEIVALARSWAGDDPERLREAERILAKSRYLEGEEHDQPAA